MLAHTKNENIKDTYLSFFFQTFLSTMCTYLKVIEKLVRYAPKWTQIFAVAELINVLR